MKQLRISGYIRVSTEEQAALVDGSLDNQRYRLNAFVDVKNLQEPGWGKIVEFYVDDGYSAKDTKRPAFQRMMADLRRGKIDLILVPDLSRLSRSISDFCGILEILKEHEASFLSIKENFDSSTPAGKMMLYNMINLAQFEREQTAERVALGCHARAMRGLLNGGQEILGYDKSVDRKNTYMINEEEAEKVRLIFNTFLECGSLNRTSKILKDMGLRPKVKKNRNNKIVDRGLWTHRSLGDLLRSHAYIGEREVNRRNKESNSKRLKAHEQYQLVKATWPAIVDIKTFDAAQTLLTENRRLERRRLQGGERRVFLASGIIKCKECSRPMVGQSSHGQMSVHRYYTHAFSKGDVITCSVKRIRAEDVEEAISHHIVQIMQEGQYLDGVASRIASQSNDAAGAARGLRNMMEKDLKQVELEMENAFKFQIQADPSSEAAQFLFEKLEGLGQRKALLRKQLDEVQSTGAEVIPIGDIRMDLGNQVFAASKGWKKLSDIQKKRALRRLIQRVLVGSEGLDIYYYMNSLRAERSLGFFSNDKEKDAKVLPWRPRGTISGDSKQQVENCLSGGVVKAAPIYSNRAY